MLCVMAVKVSMFVVMAVFWLNQVDHVAADLASNKEFGKDFSDQASKVLSQSNGENETVYDDIIRLNFISLAAFYDEKMKKYRNDLVQDDRHGKVIKKGNIIEEGKGHKKDNHKVERIIRSIHRKLSSHMSKRKLRNKNSTTTNGVGAKKRNLHVEGNRTVDNVEAYPDHETSTRESPLSQMSPANELTSTAKLVGKVRSTDQIIESYGTLIHNVDESIRQFHKKEQGVNQRSSGPAELMDNQEGRNNNGNDNNNNNNNNNMKESSGMNSDNADSNEQNSEEHKTVFNPNVLGNTDTNTQNVDEHRSASNANGLDKTDTNAQNVEKHRSGLNPDVLLTDAQHIDEQSQQLKSIAKELDAKAELLRTQALTNSAMPEAKKQTPSEQVVNPEKPKTEVYQGKTCLSCDVDAGAELPVSNIHNNNKNKNTEANSNKFAYQNSEKGSQESHTQTKTSSEEYFSPHKTTSLEDGEASNEKSTSTLANNNGKSHATPEQNQLPCRNQCPEDSDSDSDPSKCQCISFPPEEYKIDDEPNSLQKDLASGITTGEERNLCGPLNAGSLLTPPKWSGPPVGSLDTVQSVGVVHHMQPPNPINMPPCQTRPVVTAKGETQSAPVVVSLKLPPGGPKRYELTLKEITNKTIYPSQLMAQENGLNSRDQTHSSSSSFPLSSLASSLSSSSPKSQFSQSASPSSTSQDLSSSSARKSKSNRYHLIDDTTHMPVTEKGFRESSEKASGGKKKSASKPYNSRPILSDTAGVEASKASDLKASKTSDTSETTVGAESEIIENRHKIKK